MVEMLRLTLRPESTTQTYQETGERKKLLQLRLVIKGAGAFEAGSQTKEEFSANDTSRHPKLFKIGPNHGCQ